jgi:hypothetical protein
MLPTCNKRSIQTASELSSKGEADAGRAGKDHFVKEGINETLFQTLPAYIRSRNRPAHDTLQPLL